MGNPAVDYVEKITSLVSVSKLVYEDLIFDASSDSKKKDKWEVELEKIMSMRDFYRCLSNIDMITNVSKLRSFQYRLLHRAVILNDRLFLYKIHHDSKCTFCGEHKETYVRLFFQCIKVRCFLERIYHEM